MSLKARIEQLHKRVPCAACGGQLPATVFRSLWPGEPAMPEPSNPEPVWCPACGRRTSVRVLTVIHEQV